MSAKLYTVEESEEFKRADELARLTGSPWEFEFTGGGCTAITLQLGKVTGSHYFMVTTAGDASIPMVGEPHHLGEYVNDEDINHFYFANRRAMLVFLRSWNKHQQEGI
jgi:hypothetical protein